MSRRTGVAADAPGVPAGQGKEALRLWLRMLGNVNLIESWLKGRLREDFGVTLAQFDLMAEIARDETPKTMSQVSALLMVSNGNVTGVVDRLSREGLVERLPSPEDRRAYLLSLTPLGEERFRMMAEAHERWLAQLFETLEPEFVRSLSQALRELRGALKTATGEEP